MPGNFGDTQNRQGGAWNNGPPTNGSIAPAAAHPAAAAPRPTVGFGNTMPQRPSSLHPGAVGRPVGTAYRPRPSQVGQGRRGPPSQTPGQLGGGFRAPPSQNGGGFPGARPNLAGGPRPVPQTQPARPQPPPQSQVGQPQAPAVGINDLPQVFQNLNLGMYSNVPAAPAGATSSILPYPLPPQSKLTTFPVRPTNAPTGWSTNYPMANSKRYKWFVNNVCFKSPYKRWTFDKGDVIAVPYHVANMNENLDIAAANGGCRETKFGPILSKQRMCIVLWKHHECMTCLPLYSHGHRGIAAKQGDREEDYIEVLDLALKSTFIPQGSKKPLEHIHWSHPHGYLTADTICHLTGAMKVSWQEPILHLGRVTKLSYDSLVKYHKALMRKAELEKPDKEWPAAGVNPKISHDDY